MRRLTLIVMSLLLGLALAAARWWLISSAGHPEPDRSTLTTRPLTTNHSSTPPLATSDSPTRQPTDLPKLPETDPPAGLPITVWGKRDHFEVIRNPWLVDARRGDIMLAPDEPVLGIVLGKESRAYSTNQLNSYELVEDEIGGTPILVTY